MSTADRLQDVFRDVFDDPELVITDETTSADIEDWDSLAHVSLIFSVESEFDITFSDRELSGLARVGDMRRVVEERAV